MIEYRDKDTLEIRYWYEPREIRFTREQVKWLLPYLLILRDGHYPKQPEGYNNCEVFVKNKGNAAFTRPVELAAELDARLQVCLIDGLITEAYYCHELPIMRIMYYCDQTKEEVWDRIGRCIRYCAGWRRKQQSYRDWCNHKKKEE